MSENAKAALLSPSDHYAEASAILRYSGVFPWGSPEHAGAMAEARVHATLSTAPWSTYGQARDAHAKGDLEAGA